MKKIHEAKRGCPDHPLTSYHSPTTPTPTPAPGMEHEKPALSNTLKRDCQPSRPDGRNQFDNAGLEVGERAVDFTLKTTDGTELTLSELLAEKPVMMVFGSFT